METRGALRYHLLRPLLVRRHGDPLPLGGPKPRSVLAALLLDANRVVPDERLIGLVWGDRSPPSVRTQIQVHISGLRKAVGATTIRRSATGYQIEVRPGELDLHEFEELVARARADAAAGRAESAAERFRTALALWPGPELDGVTEPLLAREGPGLAERRMGVLEDLYELELVLGEPADLVGVLRRATREHPLRERLHAQLMRALHRSGRTAEALRVYTELRERLVGELGVEPGQLLRRAQRQVLRDERGPEGEDGRARLTAPVPRQLPADLVPFTGRSPELSGLDALLAGGSPPTLVTIVGTAGVGKTTFAVHWAHRVAARFPDGQLYADLRGFAEAAAVVPPAQVIRGFLEALGVAPGRVPTDPDTQAGLYRSLLADRRMLVVLDNARDAAQVRPLLAGSPRCLTLVTSRNQLVSLVAGEAAHPVTLDLLSEPEARELLVRRLGPHRVAAEPAAVAELVGAGARLPLALAIVAARAAIRPDFSLASLAGQLRTTQERLDALAAGGADASHVSGVFAWSYRTLSPAAARLFRLLGLHPGPDIGFPALAALAGEPPDRLRGVLTELTDAHLLTEPAPSRYAFHDLLRAYASEVAGNVELEPELRAARSRMLDHYLSTAFRAATLMEPGRRPITLPVPPAAVEVSPLRDEAEATAWFAAEHPVLWALVEQAAAAGLDAYPWRLVWTLSGFADHRGYWRELAAASRVALTTAARADDCAGQAVAHRSLSCAHFGLGDYRGATRRLASALACYNVLEDQTGYAEVARNLALVLAKQQRWEEALAQVRAALERYPADAPASGRARMLNDIGWLQARLGRFAPALDQCRRALVLHQGLGDRGGEANAWDSLGYIYHRLGDHRQAVASYQNALERFQAVGNRYLAATALVGLGDVHRDAGDGGAAREAWSQARDVFAGLDHPDADAVARRLDKLAS